jgi:hypothetical protein
MSRRDHVLDVTLRSAVTRHAAAIELARAVLKSPVAFETARVVGIGLHRSARPAFYASQEQMTTSERGNAAHTLGDGMRVDVTGRSTTHPTSFDHRL